MCLNATVIVLHWVIAIIPFAVFGIVAFTIGTQGLQPFVQLGVFVLCVILALILQACYYLTRIRLLSWVRPLQLLRGTRDALVLAFSTASATAAMPVTYACLRDKVGLREKSASLGALDLIEGSHELRDRLRSNTERFRRTMGELGFDILPGEHPIVPVMVGDEVRAAHLSEQLVRLGVYAVSFSYPVVPRGTARSRTQMSAAHTPEDVDFAVEQFAAARDALAQAALHAGE